MIAFLVAALVVAGFFGYVSWWVAIPAVIVYIVGRIVLALIGVAIVGASSASTRSRISK